MHSKILVPEMQLFFTIQTNHYSTSLKESFEQKYEDVALGKVIECDLANSGIDNCRKLKYKAMKYQIVDAFYRYGRSNNSFINYF